MPRKALARTLKKASSPAPGACSLVIDGAPCPKPARTRGLCPTHYTYAVRTGRLGELAAPSAKPSAERERVISRKPDPADGVCPLVDNGVACARPVRFRGLCDVHRLYLKAVRKLETFAAPSEQSRKSVFSVDPNAPEGICWVVQDGRSCVRQARPSGICATHRSVLHKRPDLPISSFTRKSSQTVYSRRKDPEPGRCVVRECRPVPGEARGRFVPCENESVSRGLCQKHRHRLEKTPALFRQIADPIRKKTVYRIKADLRDGVCVVIEDDVGCTIPTTHARRVCDLHRTALGKGLLRKLTDRFVGTNYSLERKPPHAIVEGFCLLVVNGVSCTNAPQHRGICHACYHLVKKYGDYEALALPLVERPEPSFSRKDRPLRGVCVVVEDEVPCRETPHARGICRRHYRLVDARGRLDELGLGVEELAHLAQLPHYYLDKNVAIRFAMHELFAVNPDHASVALVRAVLRGRVRATVSLDCVRAIYSHVGHRLARPVAEGGGGLQPADAEKAARNYAGKLFFGSGGLWNFLAPTEESFRVCAHEGRLPGLSLEDALEVHLYAVAKAEHGAEMFVTADNGILEYGEAVHPDKVVRASPELFR